MKTLLFSLFLSSSVLAQLPETDIWLFKLEKKEGNYSYASPLNINNRKGYDNQPVFSADDKMIFYVCIDDSKQADIYKYDLKTKQHVNISKTPGVSEYSPTMLANGKGFSTVVVETDSAQRVWQYSLEGKFDKILTPVIDSVGYHTWLGNDSLMYYKLTEPHSLRVADLTTDKDVWIC